MKASTSWGWGYRLAGLTLLLACSMAWADPSDFYFYTVRKGDTLESVGRQYRVDWKSIAQLNGMRRPYGLQKGQVLKIPRQKFRVKAFSTTRDVKDPA